jgi:hypothetical protein
MGLAAKARQLMSAEPKAERPIPVEIHFLSYRELYDDSIFSVDRHHSSAGEWVVYGDQHWYTVAVVTRPAYALPQELCLSFDCVASPTRQSSTVTRSSPPQGSITARLHSKVMMSRQLISYSCRLSSAYLASTSKFSISMTCKNSRRLGSLLHQILASMPDGKLIDALKSALLQEEHFVWQKFRDFIEEFLPEQFWQPDECIRKVTERRQLKKRLCGALYARCMALDLILRTLVSHSRLM